MPRPTRLFSAVLICLSLAACDRAASGRAIPGGEEFGAGLTLQAVTPFDDVVARPDAYADRAVLLEGEVRDVCQRKGCWMVVTDGASQIRVRFRDYAFFVPTDAAGKHAYVEGRVQSETLSEETLRHYAEESGRGAEASEGHANHGPQTGVSLIASGVRLIAAR